MSLTRRSIADQMDGLDEEISELQKDRAEIYAAYREQQEKDGVSKTQIKVEVAALKAAIQRRRKIKQDAEAIAALDALQEEILTEIQSGTPIATRAPAPRASENADGLDVPEFLRR